MMKQPLWITREEWVFSLIAVNGYLSAVSLPVNAWWTGSELQQLGEGCCCMKLSWLNASVWSRRMFFWTKINTQFGACCLFQTCWEPDWWHSVCIHVSLLKHMRYGLQDSQSCLLIADLERLDRAPFLEEMSCLTKGQNVDLVAHFGHTRSPRQWVLSFKESLQYVCEREQGPHHKKRSVLKSW